MIDFPAMILYLAATAFTPGPNNLMCMYLGANYGLKGSRKFIVASMGSVFVKALLCGLLNERDTGLGIEVAVGDLDLRSGGSYLNKSIPHLKKPPQECFSVCSNLFIILRPEKRFKPCRKNPARLEGKIV